ncbi:MAG TPA: DUF1015 domain-containing protein [Candidatus Hydrogenedentes bacterium]|nr:DUF1015 domain-containing protein [Candidatus Hydrogenedentota bacterium]HOL76049.1 DUF1015 domain-containing protein [Candidatus Hydrogenedentota bacterium]HPO84663.1 DUF1015 domain-containing protein [Candidatus Hydrogenedentota bacterium]
MPLVKPFQGICFDKEKVGSYSRVITPPFDVISPTMREELAKQSSYNMVHLILPEESDSKNRYEVAAARFSEWLKSGVLRQDPQEFYYLIEQHFRGMDNQPRVRRGIIGLVELPPAGEKRRILDHERTFPHKIEDRLRLMEATRAQLEIVFLLYEDKEKTLTPVFQKALSHPPDIMADTADRVTQKVWRLKPSEIVSSFFREKTLYIADGHHRFRTAVTYRDRIRAMENPPQKQEYDYALVALVDCDDPGLVIWPTHRLLDLPQDVTVDSFLKRLKECFRVEPLDSNLPGLALVERLEQENSCAIGVSVYGHGNYLLTVNPADAKTFLGEDCPELWHELDVAVLHRGILERVLGLPVGFEMIYEPDAQKALDTASRGEKTVAFFLRAIRPEQVRACADAGVYMPEKATYFFPKIPSGAVIHALH